MNARRQQRVPEKSVSSDDGRNGVGRSRVLREPPRAGLGSPRFAPGNHATSIAAGGATMGSTSRTAQIATDIRYSPANICPLGSYVFARTKLAPSMYECKANAGGRQCCSNKRLDRRSKTNLERKRKMALATAPRPSLTRKVAGIFGDNAIYNADCWNIGRLTPARALALTRIAVMIAGCMSVGVVKALARPFCHIVRRSKSTISSRSVQMLSTMVFIGHSSDDVARFDDLSHVLEREEIVATRQCVESSWCSAELGAFWGHGKKVLVYVADESLAERTLPR
jgi:hypothetical protein